MDKDSIINELELVISKLSISKFDYMIYVGKNYTIKDVKDDLKRLASLLSS